MGCGGNLIGDEYWIGTEEGIVRKPFPIIEELPKLPSPYWRWVKEMEKIRGEELKNKKE